MSEFSLDELVRVASSEDNKVEQKKSRGRKQCPKCDLFVGVRTQVCKCGHDFKKAKKEKDKPKKEKGKDDALAIAARFNFSGKGQVVYIPCGECLFKVDNIENWVENVMREGFKTGRIYSRSALKYWLRTLGRFDQLDNLEKFLGEEIENVEPEE